MVLLNCSVRSLVAVSGSVGSYSAIAVVSQNAFDCGWTLLDQH